uniref:Protein kinase domain-containing protein n=1 Tax=Arcella intermedia TaxID=1963864 RepID=A0A6B2L2L3_9EUKA
MNLEGNMSYRDILLVKKIGEGQYGDVWMGKYHDYPVACKILKRQMTDKESEKAIEELKLMAKLKHPNVVLFMGACLNDQKQICIVTEFASRGDLRTVAPQVKSLAKRLKLGLDVASGLAWIHANGIVHRDLKLPNLLVFEDWSVKIADFGLSLQLEEGVSINRFGGNVKYSAPEILKARYDESITIYPYSEKTDVYSFGLMFWELVTLKPLFIRPKEYKGKKGLAKYVLSGYRPAIEKNWPQSLTTILSNCWHQDPNRRPLFREIIGQWPSLTIDVLCPDKWGREVCKVLFVAQETVPFVEFMRAFSQTCFANPQTLQTKKMYRKFLSVLLCENEFDDTVSKQRFCNIVGWFSPVDKSQDCAKFFGRMKDLLTRRYFHGFLSETKAENQLKQLWDSTSNKQSYYVIRFSESDVGAFILTFIDFNGHIQHEKILNRGGMWYVEGLAEEYDSWSKVKQAFKQVWNIGYHLPKSPYSNLFKTGMFG